MRSSAPYGGGRLRSSPVGASGRFYETANFSSFTASKFCTPPPTRLVV